MAATYEWINGATLSSATTYLEITSIPSTYTDLVIVLNMKESAQNGLDIRVGNGSFDTGSNYSHTWIRGDGSNVVSSRSSNITYSEIGYDNSEWGNTIVQINNYANTTTYKTFLSRSNTNTLMSANVGLWRSTSAIDRVRFFNGPSNNFAIGSTINIYGIKAA